MRAAQGNESQRQAGNALAPRTLAFPTRGVSRGALPRAADAVNCKERTLAEALSLGCTQSGEATPGARASSTRSASTREQA